MAVLSAIQLMELESPVLAATTIAKNGYSNTVAGFLQDLLDTNGQVLELAMAQLFEMLAAMDRSGQITLGEYSLSKRVGLNFDERRYYWERKYRAKLFGNTDVVPSVQAGGAFMPWPVPPAIR